MSYRLFATGPTVVQLGGKPRMLSAGDRLHLSDEDARRILQSPAASKLTVATSTDPSEAPNYARSDQYEAAPEYAEIREVIPGSKDPFATPMSEEEKIDPIKGTYDKYAAEGNDLLNTLIKPSETQESIKALTEEEKEIAKYEEDLAAALPDKPNWRNIVAYLDTLALAEYIPTEYISYIKDKYKALARVVAKSNSLLGITETEE